MNNYDRLDNRFNKDAVGVVRTPDKDGNIVLTLSKKPNGGKYVDIAGGNMFGTEDVSDILNVWASLLISNSSYFK